MLSRKALAPITSPWSLMATIICLFPYGDIGKYWIRCKVTTSSWYLKVLTYGYTSKSSILLYFLRNLFLSYLKRLTLRAYLESLLKIERSSIFLNLFFKYTFYAFISSYGIMRLRPKGFGSSKACLLSFTFSKMP